jgi:hypothetical protein
LSGSLFQWGRVSDPTAALSGSQIKATGFAGGSLLGDKRDFAVAIDAASHICNVVLDEGRRLDLMHESRAYGRRERYGDAD